MSSPAKKLKTVSLPTCPYGARCYRKNPQHFIEYDHSQGDDKKIDKVKLPDSTSSIPVCRYGAKCYRKNLLHFAEFSHPTNGGSSQTDSGGSSKTDSGSDTDVIDTDEEDNKPAAKKDGMDVLNRGMSLVKSFSQMSELERKELIRKAFEVKQQLQQELEQTKKKVEEKEKELQNLQHEIATGLLLVEGEKTALEGNKIVYFPLMAERSYKEGSAAQIHFRLAESQFYRLLGTNKANTTVKKVEYVVNPTLVKNFKKGREDLKTKRGEDHSYPVLAFHGTIEQNIVPICESGFKVPGCADFQMRTDTGWYGKGVYFSEFPGYSMAYIQGATKLLLCQVLPGKVFHCTKLIHGAALQSGYDSHTSPDQKELVIFNSHHILPSYIVHYEQTLAEFKYTHSETSGTASTPGTSTGGTSTSATPDLLMKFTKAVVAKSSKVFKDQLVEFTGKLSGTHKKMAKLVEEHKGTAATDSHMTLLVASAADLEKKSKKVKCAEKNGVPIVKEEFIYDCILKKKFLDVAKYAIVT